MNATWYIRRDRAVTGPYPSDIIRRLIADGSLRASDEFSAAAGGAWETMGRFTVPAAVRVSGASATAADLSITGRYRALGRRNPYQRPIGIALIGAVLAAIVLSGIGFSSTDTAPGADCEAPPGPAVDWSGCRLEHLEADRANLAGARLRATSVPGASLMGARLTQADLAYLVAPGAALHRADLRGASLVGANLRGAALSAADLRGADLRYADLTGALIERARLEGALFDRARWVDGSHCADRSVGQCVRAPVDSQ